jgi:hypothetical protein
MMLDTGVGVILPPVSVYPGFPTTPIDVALIWPPPPLPVTEIAEGLDELTTIPQLAFRLPPPPLPVTVTSVPEVSVT